MPGTNVSRRVVISGATSGIGLATAKLLAADGDRVIGLGRSPQRVEREVGEVRAAGGHFEVHALDVRDVDAVRGFVTDLLAREGSVDVLVNAAAVLNMEPSEKVSVESFEKQFDTIVRGTFFLTMAFLPSMVAAKRGLVINLASIAGETANPKLAVYSAAKAAVISLTRSLALEYAPEGVRFAALSPGIVDTPLMNKFMVRMIADKSPLRRSARPEEIAATLRFMMSEEGSQFLGHNVVMAGGLGL